MMGLTDDQIYSVLKVVLERLSGKDVAWQLNGSVNLRVQGMEINVNDVDASAAPEQGDAIKEIFAEFLVKDYYKEKIYCRVLVFDIQGCEFEVCLYPDERLMLDKVQNVEWRGLKLPVIPLPNAREFYDAVGLHEKAEIIREYIEKNQKK